ncbi:MAG: WD40 repeat protein [Arenicella sp.]|jgi:WD40 repeat protein
MKLLATLILSLSWFCAFSELKPEVVLTTGHSGQINAIVASPDGRFLASSGNNKVIKIWELATTQEYRTLSGFDGRMNNIIFSKDNIHLAGSSSQGELIVWNVLTGEEVFALYGKRTTLSGLAFSKDGKKIIHVSNKTRSIAVTNIETGETRAEEAFSSSLCVDTNKQIVYSLDEKGNINYFSLHSESVVRTEKLFDEYNYPFSGMAISRDGKYLACGFNDDVLRVYDTDQHKFIYETKKLQSKIKAVTFDTKKPYLYVSDVSGKVTIWNYDKMKIIQDWQSDMFIAQTICAHPAGEVLIMATNSEIQLYDVKRKKVFKKLSGKTSQISWMAHDPNKEHLAVATDDIHIQIWDLKLNKVVDKIRGFKPVEFSPDGKYMYYQNNFSSIGVYDLENKISKDELNTKMQLQMAMAVSEDGKLLAGGGISMTISIWDLEKNEIKGVLKGHTGIITSVDFHPTLPLVVSTSYDQTTRIWDLKTMEEVKKFDDQIICISEAKFSPDGKLMASASWDKTILVRDVETWAVKYKLEGHKNMITSIDFNAESTILASAAGNNAVSEFDNSIISWDMVSGQKICQMNEHKTAIRKILFDANNGRIFTASEDGEIKITDPSNCELIATYVGTIHNEFAIYTPDNYYMSSKKALSGMAFRLKNRLVAFEQFDIYLNRPDIIAERLGKSSPQIIKAYKYLHKKRLRKLNIDEGDVNIDYEIPTVLIEEDVDLVTENTTETIWLSAWDDTYNIKQINVYVNDVPIYGEKGYRLEVKTKSIKKEFEIPLVEGNNRIQFSCLNENGAESLYETVDLIRDGESTKHNLYLVTIGVSDYKDDRFDLTYPRKDAINIGEKILETQGMYTNIYTKQLLDDQVTTENFDALSEFFSTCSHEDVAIVFIAGHGVLDEDFDYFFGTHNMDFDEPAKEGLAYSSIHSLLNSIKAYKKLLIMDTCHSGELDKEEIEVAPEADFIEGDIQFRSAGAGVRKKEGFGFDNSVNMMQDVFSDTRKGSGATVISSAGGAEYALESDKWKNGLFTYALLSGLANPKDVGNGDALISVTEIRAYVYRRVAELSKGKQIPTAREENINQDYIIFGN